MKLNVFKIEDGLAEDLAYELEEQKYNPEVAFEDDKYTTTLYLKRKSSENQGWIDYYKPLLDSETFNKYSENLGSESISGVYLIQTGSYTYAVTHGQAHFIVRKYCDKDFGLNLAERIVDPSGLKMKHSQTFTSVSKKDITSYTQKRKLAASVDYGEAFSYLKCKTVDKKMWGDSVDFGESARFTSGKDFLLKLTDLCSLMDRINEQLSQKPIVSLPRYRKVVDKATLEYLKLELNKHFLDFLSGVDVEDYWLTGVSFNFSNDYKYSLKFRNRDLSGVMSTLDVGTIKKTIDENKELIKDRYDLLRVLFYDEDEELVFYRNLNELVQITIDFEGKYYVLFHNEWVEFSDSYVKYVEEQVDQIAFEIIDSFGLSETCLIKKLVDEGKCTQLHKQNTYIGKYCVEQADLIDKDNVIMIKDQNQQSDLVYLVKQATTSLRLTESGELPDNVFECRNVCLWMIVNRKSLKRLSEFKSFHLLDALNDFKKEVTSKNLTPVIWVSLKN